MNRRVERRLPSARKEQLVIQDLPGETLVYDLERHRAFCLNRTAALIWRACDGKRTIEEAARMIEGELGQPVDESLILFALRRLGRHRLLEESVEPPLVMEQMTRRELARRLGIATGLLVPLITAIVAPTAAQAATCGALGAPCTTNARCCTSLCVNGICACVENQGPCTQAQPEQCCSGRCGSANNKCLP
ncbi:MAG TPA: PqqD family protein [Pyrinomonadaceae bacterium]|nr:PqqD family protein [Pyrinomonadaceae bacterium]